MTDQAIIESGMTFGPYPAGHCFYIEQSQLYKKLADGVPIAEFLLLRMKPDKPSAVWIIEAKSSSPRPETQPNLFDFKRFDFAHRRLSHPHMHPLFRQP